MAETKRLEAGELRAKAAYCSASYPVVLVALDKEAQALASKLEIVKAYPDGTNGGEFKLEVRTR